MTSGPNVVAGNFIGTNAGGADLGNNFGLLDSSGGNTVGGTTSSAANVIGFNNSAGVLITGTTVSGDLLIGNLIGTNANGANLGNGVGVVVENGSNTIGGITTAAANVIGFNTLEGVLVGHSRCSWPFPKSYVEGSGRVFGRFSVDVMATNKPNDPTSCRSIGRVERRGRQLHRH